MEATRPEAYGTTMHRESFWKLFRSNKRGRFQSTEHFQGPNEGGRGHNGKLSQTITQPSNLTSQILNSGSQGRCSSQ